MAHIGGPPSFGIISPETNSVETFVLPTTPVEPSAHEGDFTLDHALPSELTDDDQGDDLTNAAGAEYESVTDVLSAISMVNSEIPSAVLPRLPRLARSFSMPTDSHLGHLRLLGRPSSSSSTSSVYDEVSSELADAVQSIVQTLLHISPPHILEPVKEQFSSCTVQLPTPSVSALLTVMKNLNFLSANLRSLPQGTLNTKSDTNGLDTNRTSVGDKFDIGEVVQSVGDALGGIAAQAAVDLTIFHGDVGMKHMNVIGDEQSILFILTHTTRQIIHCAIPGDTIEIGLHLASAPLNRSCAGEPLNLTPDGVGSSYVADVDARISCTFDITHKPSNLALEEPQKLPRQLPNLNSVLIQRLMEVVGMKLAISNIPTTSLLCDTSYSLTAELARGPPPQNDSITPSLTLEDEEPTGIPVSHANVNLAKEPTLEELTTFSETSLRGRKATLHALESSPFARHLTGYLTSWGLDVQHLSTDPSTVDGTQSYQLPERGALGIQSTNDVARDASTMSKGTSSTEPINGAVSAESSLHDGRSFVIIDDDVDVLRRILNQYRPDSSPLQKRPSLAMHHRPRSSPQIRQILGTSTAEASPTSKTASRGPIHLKPEVRSAVIVHVTGLANYKLVKDTIQSVLFLIPPSRIPDILVVPKPAGPRRFLTALYMAVRKPLVDPFFFPIATSPPSPGGLSPSGPFSNQQTGRRASSARSRPASPTTTKSPTPTPAVPASSSGELSSVSAKSPRGPGPSSTINSSDHGMTPQPSPLSNVESLGYFAPNTVKMGNSAASGVVIQSPDGRPTGIFFQPHRISAARHADSPRISPRGGPHTPTGRGARPQSTDARPSSTRYSSDSSHLQDDENYALSPRERMLSTVIDSNSIPKPPRRRSGGIAPDGDSTHLPQPSRLGRRSGSSRSRPTSSSGNRDTSNTPPLQIASHFIQSVTTRAHNGYKSSEYTGTPSSSMSALSIPTFVSTPIDFIPPDTNEQQSGLPSAAIEPPLILTPMLASTAAHPLESTPTKEVTPIQLPDINSTAPDASRSSAVVKAKPVKRLPNKTSKTTSGITPPISVLIVEDNPINQAILTTFMRRRKLKYATANNGAEAVEKWRSGTFHLILMDIQMPVMDGIEATKQIRKLEKANADAQTISPSYEVTEGILITNHPAPSTPFHTSVIIVALTASSLQSDRVNALAAGCNDFLTKPVSLTWLDKKIIEWGSIKALQMWATPELARDVDMEQEARAKALQLHLPSSLRVSVQRESSSESMHLQERILNVPPVSSALLDTGPNANGLGIYPRELNGRSERSSQTRPEKMARSHDGGSP